MILTEINTDIEEGKLLLAALAIITTESRTSQTPDEVLKDVIDLSKKIYEDGK